MMTVPFSRQRNCLEEGGLADGRNCRIIRNGFALGGRAGLFGGASPCADWPGGEPPGTGVAI